jgi:branched-chain amino acid transport system ATP-binding protein
MADRRPPTGHPANGADGSGRLEARGVRVEFGGVRALDGVDLTLSQGERLGLIGPNGAGKSTLVNIITGFYRPTAGQVFLDGREITRLPSHRYPGRGVVRTFQNTRVFAGLSVAENVEVSALTVERSRRAARTTTKVVLEEAGLWDRRELSAGALSTGEAHRLGLARSIALRPRFLLLDEPAAGLNEQESETLVRLLVAVAGQFGFGLLVIDHNMAVVTGVAHRIQVIHRGRTLAVGSPEEIERNPEVLQAYLGTDGLTGARSI